MPPGVPSVIVDVARSTTDSGALPEPIELAGRPDRVITRADMQAADYGFCFSGSDPSDRAPEALPELARLAPTRGLRVVIWRTYPVLQVAQAHTEIEAGHNRGKVVLLP